LTHPPTDAEFMEAIHRNAGNVIGHILQYRRSAGGAPAKLPPTIVHDVANATYTGSMEMEMVSNTS
jgi:hypothetical protein